MVKIFRNFRLRQTSYALLFTIAAGFTLLPSGGALADDRCTVENDMSGGAIPVQDNQDISLLVSNFFATLDTGGSTAEGRHTAVANSFSDIFHFEVCAGGGNTMVFAASDLTALNYKLDMNYQSLQSQYITPRHAVSNTILVGKDGKTAKGRSLLVLYLQTADPVHHPVIDYTANVRSDLTKGSDGLWRFDKLWIVIDTPSIIVFAR